MVYWTTNASGPFVRRKVENGFKPGKRDKYCLMYDWMDYFAYSTGVKIEHKMNTGKEKRVGCSFMVVTGTLMTVGLQSLSKMRSGIRNRQQK